MTIVKGFEDFGLVFENVVGFFVAEEAEVFISSCCDMIFLSKLKHHVGYRRGGYGVEEGRGQCPSYRRQRHVPRVLWRRSSWSWTILPVALGSGFPADKKRTSGW